jgi:hypothetical protein
MQSDRWTRLCDQFARQDAVRRERQRRCAEAVAALQEFHDWCTRTEQSLMETLASVARARGKEFCDRTGAAVTVTHPSDPPIESAASGHRMAFLCIELRACRVYVYVTRGPGALPYLHYARARDACDARPGRIVSLPGFLVARRGSDDYELRALDCAARPETDRASLDAVVYRAFELLVAGSGPSRLTVPS